jgi:hypothetical protein
MLELVDLTQEAVKSAMGFEERAKAAEAKVAELEKKIAGHKPEVTLQKVAFEQPAINRVVQSLVDRSILPADEQVKTAAMLKDDPSFALDLLERVASLQEFPTGPVGRGIPKNANEKENYSTKLDSDPDGWGKVVTEGA